MAQERDILGYSPIHQESSNQLPEDRNQGQKRHPHEYDRLKLWSGQFILVFTLVINLLTTLVLILLILRLQLNRGTGIVALGQDERELTINQGIVTDTLIPQGLLKLNRILGDTITISSFKQAVASQGAEIRFHQQDSISIQAKSFGFGPSGNINSFKLPKRLDVLEVPHEIKGLKAIRAPSARHVLSEASDDKNVDLDIESLDGLDISGNMGLKIHSRRMHMKSPSTIRIESKEESIRIMSDEGLLIPFISHENRNNLFRNRDDSSIESRISTTTNDDANDEIESDRISKVCIGRDEGVIFLASESCLFG